MTGVELLTFSMRTEPPKAGADWFRIVKAKKASEPTKVYIYDEIGFWGTTAKDFAAMLDEIDSSEIHVHFNSPGGSVFDGLAIHASIKAHKAKVTGYVDGVAASAASFILQACDNRVSTRNAQIMIHDAKAYAGGNAQQMRNAADTLDRISDNIADIYAVRSGQTKSASEFRNMMKAGDKWYNGNEALDDGLVDEVLDNPVEDDDAENLMTNTWSTEEIQNFLQTAPDKLAAQGRVSVTNRVEEAQMTGEDPNKNTPPPVAQPPAPTAQATAPAAPAAAPVAPVAPVQQAAPVAGLSLIVNGAQVSDLSAVQAHITALETFKNETIEGNRKSFVAQLVKDNKILSSEETIKNTEELALSMSDEQFSKWKASMDTAPAQNLLGSYGVGPGEKHAPSNGTTGDAEKTHRITVLTEIVDSHKASGLTEDEIKEKSSYKELQALLGNTAN